MPRDSSIGSGNYINGANTWKVIVHREREREGKRVWEHGNSGCAKKCINVKSGQWEKDVHITDIVSWRFTIAYIVDWVYVYKILRYMHTNAINILCTHSKHIACELSCWGRLSVFVAFFLQYFFLLMIFHHAHSSKNFIS